MQWDLRELKDLPCQPSRLTVIPSEDTILEEKPLLLHSAGVKIITSGCLLCAKIHILGPQSYPHFTRKKTEAKEVRDVAQDLGTHGHGLGPS